ncbi:DNA internalization-related competence protein ComEC/Rec2 [Alicycliphilus sp. B1]|nr:DNA internalization-related competence protein ComEC/Rec2 [Alicycliphilus sp. B1]
MACAVVLAADPWALLQPGFWLSFVAVAVLFATDMGAAGARPTGAAGRFLGLLREQWVVTLALTPLTLLLFGQVSIVGLLANLLAIPWTTLVVTPLALLGVLWAPLWQAAAWCVQWLTVLLQWLAAWPWAQVSLPMAPQWAGALAVAGGVLLALRLPWGVRALGLPLLLPALWWQPPRPAPGQFELLAADVGQGQAVLVRTARHALLYDAGPRYHQDSDAGERVLAPLLRALGERLDLLVLSHGDTDHTGGAAAVLARQPQARVLGSIGAGHPLQSLRPIEPCLAGRRWEWDGVRFEVLHPPRGVDATAPGPRAPRPNAHSCVLRISAGAPPGASALLAGDVERAQEQSLVAGGALLAADVLLVPHHGSKTSSSEDFVDAVRPAPGPGAGRLPQPLRPSRAPRWRRATRSAVSPWCRRPGAARRAGRRPRRRSRAASARPRAATGTTPFPRACSPKKRECAGMQCRARCAPIAVAIGKPRDKADAPTAGQRISRFLGEQALANSRVRARVRPPAYSRSLEFTLDTQGATACAIPTPASSSPASGRTPPTARRCPSSIPPRARRSAAWRTRASPTWTARWLRRRRASRPGATCLPSSARGPCAAPPR